MTNYVNIEKFIHDPKTKSLSPSKTTILPSEDEKNLSNSDLTMEKVRHNNRWTGRRRN